jgi:hypothetical protein
VLPPGGEGEIKVTLRPKAGHTQITKRIVVISNDPEQPKFALTLSGSLLVDLEAKPAAISMMGLKVGASAKQTFALELHEGTGAKVKSVKIEDDENFDLRRLEGDPEGNATYEVSFRGRDKVGHSTTRVLVETTGENTPELVIPVRASAATNLRYVRNVRFNRKNGELQERVVRISARDGEAPTLEKVIDPDRLLDSEILEPRGAMASVRLSVREDAWAKLDEEARKKPHRLIIHTDDREEPRIEISYRIALESETRPVPARRR